MEVRFVAPDLRRLDATRAEAISLPIFSDERPLCGPLGLVDWRMAGGLSRQVFRGRLSGQVDEVVLLPSEMRFPFEKIFVFGMGARADFDAASFRRGVSAMLETLARARVRASICSLPGRDIIMAADAARIFLEQARGLTELDQVTLIEDTAAQREMEPIVAHERRRERAEA